MIDMYPSMAPPLVPADAARAGLLPATDPCNCESYEPCYGACCGPGQCSCSLPKCPVPIDEWHNCESPLPCQVHPSTTLIGEDPTNA